MLTYDTPTLRQTGSRNLTGPKTLPTIWSTYMKLVTKYQISAINSCWEKCAEKWAYMFNVYKNQQSRQTGSRNLMGPKMLPTIWGTDMKLVTKYQICVINNCWEKCDEKCAYMFNVYKNQLSRQTGSRNLTGLKMLPTIWHTYMKLGTKYQISAIDSCWEKCDEKYLGRMDRRTEVKQYTPLPSGERGYNYPLGFQVKHCYFLRMIEKAKMPTLSSDFPRHFLLFFQDNYMHAKLPDLSEMFWLHGFWRSVVIFRIESKSKMCIILFRAAPNTRWPHLSLYAVCYIDICYMFSTTTACQNTNQKCSSIVLLLFRIFLTGLSWPWLYVFLQLPLQSVHMITTKVVSSNDVHGEVVFDITTLCDKVCQWLVTDQWFYLGTMVSSINKTDRHDITEI